ncbi:MAG: primosomal protein N' [Symbiobacteriaceae bacterium]|nr:primosomal protein N' [Symbiobacteriaceae bacterium]
MRYALVKLDRTVEELAEGLTYSIPASLGERVVPGSLVTVPLRQEITVGVVVQVLETPPSFNVRPLTALWDDETGPTLNNEQMALLDWLSESCLSSWANALAVVLPLPGRSNLYTAKGSYPSEHFRLVPSMTTSSPGRGQIVALWQRMLAGGATSFTRTELQNWSEYSAPLLRRLVDKGLVEPYTPVTEEVWLPPGKVVLTSAQLAAMQQLQEEFTSPEPRPVLLHGVTGSGKTEIYMQLIAEMLRQGRTAMILVPEITLTVQMRERFLARFGPLVAMLHSGMSRRERTDSWQRVKKGEARVVLGARSAVFAPLKNIGLIVLDEEHEQTFKNEEEPKYHAREVAAWRASRHGAKLLFGSATPAVDSYYAALQGTYRLVTLGERIHARPLAQVDLVDMRRELREGNRTIFSRLLLTELQQVVARQEQAIIFHNRRGLHRMTLCRSCGLVLECPECEIPLVEHGNEQGDNEATMLKCHICGYTQAMPALCPSCASKYLRFFGLGTEKVMEECQKLFPEARILRLDADATSRQGAKASIVKSFSAREAEILVGTQMVAKGLDFPAVTLVGVISADSLLRAPDYRGAERAFALLTQVSGRAGRGDKAGRVIIQSYAPEHPLVLAAQMQDYQIFYEAEVLKRQRRQDPPFAALAWLLVAADTPLAAFTHAREWAMACTPTLLVRGPQVARQYKLGGRYRYQLLLKAPNREILHRVLQQRLAEYKAPKDIMVSLTLDPLSM